MVVLNVLIPLHQIGGVDGVEPSPFVRSRKRSSSSTESHGVSSQSRMEETQAANWRRILLLIVAITVHNVPGTHTYMYAQCQGLVGYE